MTGAGKRSLCKQQQRWWSNCDDHDIIFIFQQSEGTENIIGKIHSDAADCLCRLVHGDPQTRRETDEQKNMFVITWFPNRLKPLMASRAALARPTELQGCKNKRSLHTSSSHFCDIVVSAQTNMLMWWKHQEKPQTSENENSNKILTELHWGL